jgi:hypothetical protein
MARHHPNACEFVCQVVKTYRRSKSRSRMFFKKNAATERAALGSLPQRRRAAGRRVGGSCELQTSDPTKKTLHRTAGRRAASFCVSERCIRNHAQVQEGATSQVAAVRLRVTVTGCWFESEMWRFCLKKANHDCGFPRWDVRRCEQARSSGKANPR